jgi:hypothetical protein
MLDSMRKSIFIVALVVIFLIVLVELGSMAVLGVQVSAASTLGVSTTGKAIPALALLDGLVLYATLIIGIALLIPERVQSKVQGIVTLVFSFLLLLACIRVFFVDLALLLLMISLLMAVPFGPIAYVAIWGSFDTSGAQITLGLLTTLKIIFAVCLVLAHQRFLQNKGLVLIIITSLVANLIIAFLHGFVPGFLVSVTDDIGALIVCILAAIWGIVYMVGGIISVIKTVL